MSYLIICSVAFLASALTFFSGFGLGTLLLPAFAVFFAVEQAVALTAVVHFLNGGFKLFLVWRHIDWSVVWRFGLPAIIGALVGAWTLLWLSGAQPLLTYLAFGRAVDIAPAKMIVGILLLVFACVEVLPFFRNMSFPRRYLALGGVLSGFFGGLAGMQGALRSAFLVNAGLSKQGFVGTASAIGFLIDLTRLGVYSRFFFEQRDELEYGLLATAVICAFAGAALGNSFLPKVTMRGIRRTVASLLFLVGVGLVSGLL
jgi:uncharacterized protein